MSWCAKSNNILSICVRLHQLNQHYYHFYLVRLFAQVYISSKIGPPIWYKYNSNIFLYAMFYWNNKCWKLLFNSISIMLNKTLAVIITDVLFESHVILHKRRILNEDKLASHLCKYFMGDRGNKIGCCSDVCLVENNCHTKNCYSFAFASSG